MYDESYNFLQGYGYNLYNLDGEYELVAAYFAGLSGVSNDQAAGYALYNIVGLFFFSKEEDGISILSRIILYIL